MATSTPDIYGQHLPVFERLLHDVDEGVRMKAPEMLRVLGKRKPEFVEPFLGLLQTIAETDDNRVVRVRCLSAIKVANQAVTG